MKKKESILLKRLRVQAGRRLTSDEVDRLMKTADTASRRTLALACEALASQKVTTAQDLWDAVVVLEESHRISHFAHALSHVMREHGLDPLSPTQFVEILTVSLQRAGFKLYDSNG